MIRSFCAEDMDAEDMDALVRLWFEASVQSHDFIPLAHWEAEKENLRTLYLPLSDEIVVHVDDDSGEIDAFFAFAGDFLAALFVAPAAQGKGLGSRLLHIARRMHPALTLAVYAENRRAVNFYRQNGLTVYARRTERSTGHRELLMKATKELK